MLNSDAKAEIFDHVKIAVRERPIDESNRSDVRVMLRTDEEKLVAFYPDSKEGLVYNYDYFFPEDSTQIDVFQTIGIEMVDLALGGFSTACIATGPSASGKTHGLFGSSQEPGLIQLTTKELFHQIQSQTDFEYTVKMAYWEMSCDTICDALSEADDIAYSLRKSTKYGATAVSGLNVVEVNNWDELDEYLMQGNIRRIQLSERRQSRWHGFIRIFLDAFNKADPTKEVNCMMTFVHTKGTDRVGQKGVQGMALQNGCQINKSVSLFGSAVLHAVDFRRQAINEAAKSSDGCVDPATHLEVINKSTSFFMECKFTQLLAHMVCGTQACFMLCSVSALDYHDTTDALETLQNIQQLTVQLSKQSHTTEYGQAKKKLEKLESEKPASNLASGHPLTELEEHVERLKAKLSGNMQAETAEMDIRAKKEPIPAMHINTDQQLWKTNTLKAKLHGDRATVYIPTINNRQMSSQTSSIFSSKNSSQGSSSSSKGDSGRQGLKNKKNTYKGQWQNGCRHGYGEHLTSLNKYEGFWKAGMRDGEGTSWVRKSETDEWKRVYRGMWRQDKKHGYGIHWGEDGSMYEGYYEDGKRCGVGKLFCPNGDRIEGQFQNGEVHGWATLFCKNGDIFEGHWIQSQREGPGVWYYTTKRQLYRGEWHCNTPKFGVIEDMPSKDTNASSRFIPRVGLLDPDAVLTKEQKALDDLRQKVFAAKGQTWHLAADNEDVSW